MSGETEALYSCGSNASRREPVLGPSTEDLGPESVWVFLTASRWFCIGSGFLLAAAGFLLAGDFIVASSGIIAVMVAIGLSYLVLVLTVLGVVVHAVGWIALNEASTQSWPMRALFFLSLIGLVTGVAVFLWRDVPQPGLFLLFGGWILLPFLPIVFGPVAIGHASVFLLATERLQPPRRFNLLLVGVVTLLVLAVFGLFLYASNPSGSLEWIPLTGLMSLGYGFIFLELREEYDRRCQHLALPWISQSFESTL
jgi:hypothetical protein